MNRSSSVKLSLGLKIKAVWIVDSTLCMNILSSVVFPVPTSPVMTTKPFRDSMP